MAKLELAKVKKMPTPELVAAINEHHRQTCGAGQTMLGHAIAAGKLLIEAKGRCDVGGWTKWVEKHCNFSYSTARNYVRLASGKSLLKNAAPIKPLSPPDGGSSGSALPERPPGGGAQKTGNKVPNASGKVAEESIRQALAGMSRNGAAKKPKKKPKPEPGPKPAPTPAGTSRLSNAAETEDIAQHDDPEWLHGTRAETLAKLKDELATLYKSLSRVDKFFTRLGHRPAVERHIRAIESAHNSMKAIAKGL